MNLATPNPLDDDAIEATAAAWLAQRAEGLSSAQVAEFARWRAADARHAAALSRLEQTCALLEKLPRVREQPGLLNRLESVGAPASRPKIARIPAARLLGAIAAALAIAATGWWIWQRDAREVRTYATTADGYTRATLPDGSIVELNANSAVAVQFTGRERSVTLTQGEAHFSVAKNPARPFIVSAGQVRVRAVGTAFNVRLASTGVDVLVTEGKVRVSQAPALTGAAHSNAATTTTAVVDVPELVAGQRAMIASAGSAIAPKIETVAPAVVRETLAWQAPRLAFADTPLGDVVEQFNRRNRIQLVIADPEIATRPVGGHFRADYVEAFVRLLETTHDISVERPDADHIVLRKGR